MQAPAPPSAAHAQRVSVTYADAEVISEVRPRNAARQIYLVAAVRSKNEVVEPTGNLPNMN